VVHLLAGFALLLALQQTVAAGPEISHVDVRMSPTPAGEGVDVVARYELRLPDAAASVALRSVAFLGARPVELSATLEGEPVDVELGPGQFAGAPDSTGLTGVVRFEPRKAGGDSATLELRYRANGSVRERGDDVRVVVPLLLVVGKPADSREELFRLQVKLPSELHVYEFFPTVPRSVAQNGESTDHVLTLQAIPAMVRWRGQVGKERVVTFQGAVDLFTIAVLVLLSAITYRVIRAA
jgi:hypothetical protein